jgi:hypothetical protein
LRVERASTPKAIFLLSKACYTLGQEWISLRGETVKFHDQPRDPRSRAVMATADAGNGLVSVELECGHVTRRRPLCSPSRVICRQC